MKYEIYSVKDELIGYNAPFIMVNRDVAKREFVNSLRTNNNKNDLSLRCLGEFDDETGVIAAFPADELILRGSDVAKED